MAEDEPPVESGLRIGDRVRTREMVASVFHPAASRVVGEVVGYDERKERVFVVPDRGGPVIYASPARFELVKGGSDE